MSNPTCPYCGEESERVDSAVVYGKSYGDIFLCKNWPECDAYVGVHRDSGKPKGSLANQELRNLRKLCHNQFDTLWMSGAFKSRSRAYQWLSVFMEIPEAHIGEFRKEDCIKLLNKLRGGGNNGNDS